MPNPSFLPVIGSSFDALAAQQANWAGFNANIENQNIARAAEAQRTQNDWLRNVALLQQAAMDRDVAQRSADAQQALSLGLRQQDIAREDVASTRAYGLEKERLAAENARTQKMGEVASTTLALKNKQADQAVDVAGQAAASSFLIAKKHAEQAQHAVSTLQDQLDSMEADRKLEMDKEPKKRDLARVSEINNRAKVIQAQMRSAETAKNRAENNLANLQLSIQNRGFVLDEDNSQILHPPTGKSWKFSTVLKAAKDSLSGGETAAAGGGEPDYSQWASAFNPYAAGMDLGTPGASPPLGGVTTDKLRFIPETGQVVPR